MDSPSKGAMVIARYIPDLAHEIDRHAAEKVIEERERCVAWALTFTLITELLDGIESGKWPQKTP